MCDPRFGAPPLWRCLKPSVSVDRGTEAYARSCGRVFGHLREVRNMLRKLCMGGVRAMAHLRPCNLSLSLSAFLLGFLRDLLLEFGVHLLPELGRLRGGLSANRSELVFHSCARRYEELLPAPQASRSVTASVL